MTAYRELEETVHQQCEELRGWSEQYHTLMKKHLRLREDLEKKRVVARSDYEDLQKSVELAEKKVSMIEEADRLVSAELADLRAKNEQLEKSNRMVEDGQKQRMAEINRLSNALNDARCEIDYLKNRGLWARIMNHLPVKE